MSAPLSPLLLSQEVLPQSEIPLSMHAAPSSQSTSRLPLLLSEQMPFPCAVLAWFTAKENNLLIIGTAVGLVPIPSCGGSKGIAKAVSSLMRSPKSKATKPR